MELIPIDKDIAIRIENLSFSYPDGTPALSGVNFLVRKGESVAVLGPNGAGKSTLALHLNGILKGEGKVEILKFEVNKKNLREIRKHVGLVFQDPDDQLFTPTVKEDVAFGLLNQGVEPKQVEEAVERALEWVGMPNSESRSPHHLSFGEKKRISLATVLSMSPEILVLDEPASNLDPRGRRELIELIKTFGTTKIIITHDTEMARELCERTVILDQGRIVVDGETADVLRDEKLLDRHGLL
ncbi:MAG: ABC transporter ATP-binding protein [Actinomycetota bacterium]|nr:ABC transporter ATP-binding protein [Actinomycetota bacterium]